MASLYNIHLRTGCFCNTGACQSFLGISNQQMRRNLQVKEVRRNPVRGVCLLMLYFSFCFFLEAGHVCGDSIDLVDGQPTGSVRVSFGYMSTFEDCQNFLNFVAECFVAKPVTVDRVRLERLQASKVLDEKPPIETPKEGISIKAEEEKKLKVSANRVGPTNSHSSGEARTLTNIYIYPIKSCGAYEV